MPEHCFCLKLVYRARSSANWIDRVVRIPHVARRLVGYVGLGALDHLPRRR